MKLPWSLRSVPHSIHSSLGLALLVMLIGPPAAESAVGTQGMIATVHPLASRAAADAFRDGGNAVDAALAAAVTLGVVDGHNSGLGGGCFVLIRTPDGAWKAIDGREMAPAAATRDMFLRDGKADPELSRTGPLAVGVPGALAAYERVSREFGRRPLADSINAAADIASDGFRIDRVYARNLENTAESIAKFPATRELLQKPDGSNYVEGDRIQLNDLATTYRSIARGGSDWFYRGPLARQIGVWMQENGGRITADDFANYEAKFRQPIVTTYRDYQIVGFPPPSSGGIHVAQILNILESFEMPRLLREQPDVARHVIAEAMKLAFADRAFWLGDADFVKVPRGLIDKAYAKKLARQIQTDRAIDVPRYGTPTDWQTEVFGKHTTHITAADAEGFWVAITATVNTSFGSKVVVPGTGLVLNNEMDDFSAQPGVPNAFGLIGAEANAVAPGKRPLSSMSPTIVLKDGKPVLTLGAAGGPKIITQVVLGIVRHLDGGMSIAESLAAPRMHHQWRPNQVWVESDFDLKAIESLLKFGHSVAFLESGGVSQAIVRQSDGSFIGISDPRIPGLALPLERDD